MANDPVSGPKILPTPLPLIKHHGHGAHGVFALMREWSLQSRIPPVLLITGASGIGKRTLAYFLSQWILCEKRTSQSDVSEPGPCGVCLNCHRAIKESWVDFLEIYSHEEDSDSLKIDQFRELKSKVGFGAHEGSHKIILIPHADHMTIQAANSILKLLEEPPTGWIFMMTASDPSLLLPTIVSRCQTLRLKPIPSDIILQLLNSSETSPDRLQIASNLAQGSWGKAWELIQDENWTRRKDLFDFLGDPAGMLNPILDWATHSTREFHFLVDQLELFTLDLIQWSLDPSHYSWINKDGESALSSHAKNATKVFGSIDHARDFWLERAERFAQVRQESSAPLNKKILAQNLLIPWLAIFQ